MKSLLLRSASIGCAVLVLSACAVKKKQEVNGALLEHKPMAACVPAESGSPMVGLWYAVSKQSGVSGDFQTLTELAADGSMKYETQLKIGRKIRPALRETGCWSVVSGIYTMQTRLSNGEPVDMDDPIYRNQYRVEKVDHGKLVLRELKSGSQPISARKMQPGYRLPQ